MSRTFKNISGTFDILPNPSASKGGAFPVGSAGWHYVESVIHRVMGLFHMQEIRTPILEPTQLIARGIGQLTDIVSKEMYAFEREDTHYVLRPEVTAPVVRAYLQHNISQLGGVQRLYYIGPCFRAERPQKGRYRQFHQFGCEVIGSTGPRADVESIALLMAIYQELGLTDTTLRINSLGDAECRPRYKAALQEYFAPYVNDLSETSRKRLQTNPLRILDTKDRKERQLLAEAPVLNDYIDAESQAHYEAVKALLAALDIAYVHDPFLVRGLDYYTRTAYEVESPNLGAQSALGGGGRYDLLAQEIGSKQPVPAVGFAAGFERLFLALEAEGMQLPGMAGPTVFFVALGEAATHWAFVQTQHLRGMGIRTAYDLKGRSMKAQMREANRQQAALTVIVGDDELVARQVQVRHMASSEQATVSFDDLQEHIRQTMERLPT